MNTRSVRSLLNVFMESPIYMTLSRRERHDLVARFIQLYSDLSDAESAGQRESPPPSNSPASD